MLQHFRPALVLLGLFTLVTGLAYPLAVTGIAQALFPHQAAGSQVVRNGVVVGSQLIGQDFSSPGYFWGRPSAAGDGYDAGSSSGSNLGPTSAVLASRLEEDAARFGSDVATEAPELLTASGSGLDPHISPAAARLQIPRIAQARAIGQTELAALVEARTEPPLFGLLGEPRINVLELNLALDAMAMQRADD